MDRIFVLTYIESEILGVRIFNDYNLALKEFLTHCIAETLEMLEKDNTDTVIDCTLEIQEPQESEFETIKQYDIDYFQTFIETKEDIEEYMGELHASLKNNVFDDSVLSTFPNSLTFES